MAFDPIPECEQREVMEIRLSSSVEESDNQITSKCVVSFRTSGAYTGDYGFDRLRGGDSGRPGDVWYRDIMGQYPGNDSYRPLTVDVNEYERFARAYKQLTIEWKKAANDKNCIYPVPVMSLLKSKSATLSLYPNKIDLRTEVTRGHAPLSERR